MHVGLADAQLHGSTFHQHQLWCNNNHSEFNLLDMTLYGQKNERLAGTNESFLKSQPLHGPVIYYIYIDIIIICKSFICAFLVRISHVYV